MKVETSLPSSLPPVECAICLESDSNKFSSTALQCHPTHTFHTQCISAYMKKGGERCPLCRHPILLPFWWSIVKDVSYSLAYGSMLATVVYVFQAIGIFGLVALLGIQRNPIWVSRIWILGLITTLWSPGKTMNNYVRASILEYITSLSWLIHVTTIQFIHQRTGIRGKPLQESSKIFIGIVGASISGLLITTVDHW